LGITTIVFHSDAKGMATGVHEALADMLMEYEKMEKMEAIRTLTTWITEKRYLRDLVRYQVLSS
jgi:methionine synthase reductase